MSEQEKSGNSLSPAKRSMQRFLKNRAAVFGAGIIAAALLLSILGGTIRPDSARDANTQNVALAMKSPNFSVPVIEVRINAQSFDEPWWKQLFFGGKRSDYRTVPYHEIAFEEGYLVGYEYGGSESVRGMPLKLSLPDVVYPIVEGSESRTDDGFRFQTVDGAWQEESMEELEAKVRSRHMSQKTFLLGTDKFGRDMLSRLMAGTIVSLSVGAISVLISLLLGVALGAVAGYYGGRIDAFITWIINVVWSIPTLLLVIAITFALGKGFVQVFVAVGLTMWVEVARVVRGQAMGLKNLEFVEAARVLGFPDRRIIFRHIVPNAMGPVIVISAANFASAILLEAGLSFLGVGAQIPMASWGRMIKDHYPYITTDMAYLAILPGLCIVLLVLAFMLLGNGIQDSMDSRIAE